MQYNNDNLHIESSKNAHLSVTAAEKRTSPCVVPLATRMTAAPAVVGINLSSYDACLCCLSQRDCLYKI